MKYTAVLLVFLFGVSPVWGGVLAQQSVDIVFLDVGQGDAILIRSPELTHILVDAGPDADVVDRLTDLNVHRFELVVASHPHADHIGGMAAVVSHFPIARYLDNGAPHTTATYRGLLNALRESDITYLQNNAQTLTVGSLTIRLLAPYAEADNHNDRSVGMVVEFGEFSVLLTGDAEIDALNFWLGNGVGTASVLKASHHGSRDAVSPGWLGAVKPEAVVISAGRGNPYGHPHPWALRYYEAGGRHVYRTDLQGDITIRGFADGTFAVTTQTGAFDTR